jgi:hypothetical protein
LWGDLPGFDFLLIGNEQYSRYGKSEKIARGAANPMCCSREALYFAEWIG